MDIRSTSHQDRREHPSPGAVSPERGGFSFVELMVAILILAVGLVGMAGTMALTVRQITLGDLTTERAAAVQSAIEQIRAIDFSDLGSGTDSVGSYHVEWVTTESEAQSKVVKILTTGPGLTSAPGFPMLQDVVVDTFTYRVLNQGN